MFAKTSLSVVRAATRRRALPTDTTKRFMSEYDNSPGKTVPFNHSSKAGFAFRLGAYLGLGMAVPLIGCFWQMNK